MEYGKFVTKSKMEATAKWKFYFFTIVTINDLIILLDNRTAN